MSYTPEPIDISHITLSSEYQHLAEQLASHSHDRWAKNLLEQGWQYGTSYNERSHQHPNLVPYADLSETERKSHVLPIWETLKTLLALGYRVESQELHDLNTALLEEEDLVTLLQRLKSESHLNLAMLLNLRRETIHLQPRTPEIYRVLGDSFLQLGEPLMAYDLIAEGLTHWSADLRLQQLLALALARSGSTVSANTLLLKLVATGQRDEETLGLLARTHKDLWLQASDPSSRQQHLRLAAERYQQAYQLSNSVWTGINAATMARVMGETEQAQALACEVRDRCLQVLSRRSSYTSEEYWLLATLGEAALILSEWSAAEDFYRQAVEVGKGRFGDLSSSRRNAMLLVQHLSGDLEQVKRWFQIPRVVVFCGHMIDRPQRAQPRFPEELEPAVYAAIRDRLKQLDARLGYASAACGSDILFLEAIRELQGELHIILPYDRQQFIQDSVDIIPDTDWVNRFEQLTQQATEVIIASTQKLQENDVVYEYSNRLLHGLAKMRAEQLGTDLVPMAVWNGQSGDGKGGTADTIAHWQQWTDAVEIINLETLFQQTPLQVPSLDLTPMAIATTLAEPTLSSTTASPIEQQIRALLFADVTQYSQLLENQYIPFAQHFLGAIATLTQQNTYRPLLKNTWGDALYFVFTTVQQAGQFALDLCDLVQQIDWSSKGLPADLNLRIALHAGPVERNIDPITGQINYVGTHVNHTARIEPITPPGKVYASQAFAAIAASEELKDFTCDYVGQMPWAKRYGTFPTYHVHRR